MKIAKLKMQLRLRRRNLVLGLCLVAISIAGVWLTVESNNHIEEFLVASKSAASGSPLTASNFRVARMNLSGSGDLYLRPGQIGSQSYLLTAVESGQLIARASIATSIIDAREPVVISSTMPLPASVKPGDAVDVWVSRSTENRRFAPPVKLVLDAEIVAITEPTGMLSEQAQRVQILVPAALVSEILDAIASKDALSMVLQRNLGND
jgi:hypothetical protein